MYSLVAFLITLGELAVVGFCYLLQMTDMFYLVLVYGGPFYLVGQFIEHGLIAFIQIPVFLMMLSFHVMKYFIILRAQVVDERNPWRLFAIILEVIYLSLSWHFLP